MAETERIIRKKNEERMFQELAEARARLEARVVKDEAKTLKWPACLPSLAPLNTGDKIAAYINELHQLIFDLQEQIDELREDLNDHRDR